MTATERLSSRLFVCGVRPGPGEPRGPGETPAPGLLELLAAPRLTVAGPLLEVLGLSRPPGVREGDAPSPAFILTCLLSRFGYKLLLPSRRMLSLGRDIATCDLLSTGSGPGCYAGRRWAPAGGRCNRPQVEEHHHLPPRPVSPPPHPGTLQTCNPKKHGLSFSQCFANSKLISCQKSPKVQEVCLVGNHTSNRRTE